VRKGEAISERVLSFGWGSLFIIQPWFMLGSSLYAKLKVYARNSREQVLNEGY